MKKYISNYNYGENTRYAIDIAEEITTCLNRGEYSDLHDAITNTVSNNLVYYCEQWELMKNYQTPRTANLEKAYDMLMVELYGMIEEVNDAENADEE